MKDTNELREMAKRLNAIADSLDTAQLANFDVSKIPHLEVLDQYPPSKDSTNVLDTKVVGYTYHITYLDPGSTKTHVLKQTSPVDDYSADLLDDLGELIAAGRFVLSLSTEVLREPVDQAADLKAIGDEVTSTQPDTDEKQ